MDDEGLVAAAKTGDDDAFTAIVNRYQDQLYNMSLRLLASPADAADVVQETFTKTYFHLNDIRGATLKNWLYRVATNCARDVQRRHQRKPSGPLEDESGNMVALPDPAMGPEATAVDRERMEVIRDALGLLALDYREVVVLRDINDLSYDEIANILRCPVGTVKSRLSRARHELAKTLRNSAVLFPAAEGSQ